MSGPLFGVAMTGNGRGGGISTNVLQTGQQKCEQEEAISIYGYSHENFLADLL